MHIQAKKTVVDWSGCPIVEVVPGKVSGVPIVRRSRVPADSSDRKLMMLGRQSPEDIAYNFDLNPEGYSGGASLCRHAVRPRLRP